MKRTDREKLFRLLRAASRFESKLSRQTNKNHYGFFIQNYIWLFQVTPFIIAASFGLSRKYLNAPEYIGVIGLLFLLLSYLATLVHPFLIAWKNRGAIVEGVKEPFWLILKNAKVTTVIDSRVLPRLKRNSIENLEIPLIELKSEKEFFERRISLLVGTIDKVGLGPGLLALGIKLSDLQGNQSDWWIGLAYATPALYFIGIHAHVLLIQLDRYIKLVELALIQKNR